MKSTKRLLGWNKRPWYKNGLREKLTEIWQNLPPNFPENGKFKFLSRDPKKKTYMFQPKFCTPLESARKQEYNKTFILVGAELLLQ